jgi:hypothetical protein
MNKILFSIIMILGTQLYATPFDHPDSDKIEKKKTFRKEFNVGNQNQLTLNNQYGDIHITTWNENSISIEVIVTASSSDEKAADRKLEDINITFTQGTQTVQAVTDISDSNWSFFKKNNVQFKINYYVKMPIQNHLIVTNAYGFINLSTLEGSSKITCEYGGISIENLKNDDNVIQLEYCNNSKIQNIHNAKITSDYSNLTIGSVDNLTLNADYGHTVIDAVGGLNFRADYGDLKINNANVIVGQNDYLNLSIGKINKKLNLNCDYGTLKINKVDPNFEWIEINAEYVNLDIKLDANPNFSFDIQNDYGDIKFNKLTPTFTYKEVDGSEKNYKGTVGSKGTSTIKIRLEYGNLEFRN